MSSPAADKSTLSPSTEHGGAAIAFAVEATHGAARAGRLATPWGEVATPRFMPVGTRGPVKLLTAAQVRATGARIVLANTYHLAIHPGIAAVEALGGLHAFTGWQHGPILTDSGGYQVYSLSGTRTIDDEGVTFRSPRTGEPIRFTPAEAVDWQRRMGSDFIMQLDECAPWPCSRAEAQRAMERSLRWAEIAMHVPLGHHQVLLPIVQGSVFADLRRSSARALADLGARAYAIGGMSVGEGHERMCEALDVMLPLLPTDKPRYLMGVGKPADMLAAVARGVDLFDCVLPTRNARHSLAYTMHEGPLRLRNARFARDRGVLDPTCPCEACTGGPGYSRGFLRHLFQVDEPTGPLLVSLHNLTFFQRLMDRARELIQAGRDPQGALPPGMEASG